MKPIATFSIAAYDPDEQAWGVAVASKFLAAGALVSWARAGAGAIATQSYANVTYGSRGLDMMEQGLTAHEVLNTLIEADDGRAQRQVGIVDSFGNAAAHTGASCYDYAGHVLGEGFCCQGNILTGKETLDAMAAAFTESDGELSDRLTVALAAGDNAGGDKRGKQAAAVLVVKANAGYGGDNDRYLDLRVDDHPDPVTELKKLVAAHHVFFGAPKPEDALPIDDALARELRAMMAQAGHFEGDPAGPWDTLSKQAFWALVGNENLEERWSLDGNTDEIDRVALDYLRMRFRK